jgi:hypothetical protein
VSCLHNSIAKIISIGYWLEVVLSERQRCRYLCFQLFRAIRAYTQVYLSYTPKTCGLCRKFKGSLLGICVPLLFLLDFNVTSKHGQNSWAFLQFRFCISSQKLNRISKWKHTRWDESAFYDERLNGVRTSNDTSSKNS